jgi:hypothetical protein
LIVRRSFTFHESYVHRLAVVAALEVVPVRVGHVGRAAVVVVVDAVGQVVGAVACLAALDLDAELQVVVAELLGVVRDGRVYLVASAIGIVVVALRARAQPVLVEVIGHVRVLGVQVEETPPAVVLHLRERVGAEEVAPLHQPHVLRRVLAVRDVVAVGEGVEPGAPDDVVVVELEVGGDVVVGRRLPGQLPVEAVGGLVVDRARADRPGRAGSAGRWRRRTACP